MQENYTVGKYKLDSHQMQLLLNDQNTIVIAGAGSGKTLTIIGKVNYLIEKKITIPANILIISFTNASVNDIKNKIDVDINVFTFHKLAIYILEKANFSFKICPLNMLSYIIDETLKSLDSQKQKIVLKFLKFNYNFQRFLRSKEYQSFTKLIATFINLWKTNDLKFQNIPLNKFSKIEKEILLLIFHIYQKYNIEKNSIGVLDFDDLIIIARQKVKEISLDFDYIIIDEFQDTSSVRLELINEIHKNFNSKVIVVGDDWQSIYRFSGCDLNLFINFHTFFPNVKQIKLTNTYRNSQELINIAAQFVQRNPYQIKKTLSSPKRCKYPLILVPYTNKIKILKEVLNYLFTITSDIMILSRNNKDLYEYIDQDYTLGENCLLFKSQKIKYYTVHKSKGLEAEYVVVLNCNNEILGFPNQIENNKLIDKVLPNKEIKFAEERRLFYVAITRCKEQTFLIYNKKNPSIFIKELKKLIKTNLKEVKYFSSKN